ncbi:MULTISPECIES: S41 family peptidase [unclassified Clostridium]|uniref:S41 family peptidase n=1 Tax=unclassified Clostridium TaxID=2614128 RepID=UPI00052D393C|nr:MULTISPECIES: S41 family peptidase [unclassified Clostridium]KGK87314.1 peptidase S41 [Clostridium sp. HMP27]
MNKKRWVITTVLIVIVTNAITFLGTNTVSLMMPNGKVIVSRDDYNSFTEFSKLYEIKNVLYELYDGKIDNGAIEEGAIKGMTSALNDPYTVFMDKKEYTEFNTQTEGNYSGVGLQVQSKDNKIVIVDIFEESPAKKAGLLPRDEIEKVNGTAVSGKELDKAVTMMKGQEGTEVTLTLFREEKGNFDVKLKRAKINMVTVKGEMLDNNIGYVAVSMFDENTSKNFKKELDTLNSKGAKAFILDLRGNPGGLLDECVDMVSNFVPKDKVIVSTIDKYKREKKYNSIGGKYVGVPLVLLTDEGSASASEIFSGAIRDYKAGTLVGEKTFGKGVVQTVLETGEGTALKVTVSKYYTPNGENIHGTGIKPDIEVKYPEELLKKPYDRTTDPQFKKALEIIKGKL